MPTKVQSNSTDTVGCGHSIWPHINTLICFILLKIQIQTHNMFRLFAPQFPAFCIKHSRQSNELNSHKRTPFSVTISHPYTHCITHILACSKSHRFKGKQLQKWPIRYPFWFILFFFCVSLWRLWAILVCNIGSIFWFSALSSEWDRCVHSLRGHSGVSNVESPLCTIYIDLCVHCIHLCIWSLNTRNTSCLFSALAFPVILYYLAFFGVVCCLTRLDH